MNPETNNQNVNNGAEVTNNVVNNTVTPLEPTASVPAQPVQEPVAEPTVNGAVVQTEVTPVQANEAQVQANVVTQPQVTEPVVEPQTTPEVTPQVQEPTPEPTIKPSEPVMATNDTAQNNEPMEVMPDLTSTPQPPIVNTVVAPSKVEQTVIADNIEVMSQEVETTPSIEVTPQEVVPTDNGIREEVKLDMSVAMEGVPTIDNTNVAEAAPTQETKTIEEIGSQTEVNTQKKKTSNVIIIVILLIIAACIYFMDNITSFFNTTILPMIKNETKEEVTNGNLVDGYIKIGDPTSFVKMNGIKFYNFTTNEQNKIIFSYLSDKKLDSTDDLGFYIVFYNNDKEVTYKELFSVKNKVEKGEVSQYKISVDADVYQDSKYGKIVKYTTEELQKKYKVTCTYSREDIDNIKLKYENVYSFENDLLVSYSITKEYILPTEETETSKKYKDELDNENTKISGVGISTDYKNNKLFYSVNLNKLPDGFIPLYKKTSTKATIVKKEKLKKWECK